MLNSSKQAALAELERIPGVGKQVARDLWNIGVRSVEDLRDKSPEQLYVRLCVKTGTGVDRCMLYVFRCAVYYAMTDKHDPELLKWWRWKDRQLTPIAQTA